MKNSKIEMLINELCPNGVKYKKVEEIAEIKRGRVMSKEYLRDNLGIYPVFSSQTENNGVFGYINSYDFDFESITWTTDGAKAGSIFYHINEKYSITNVCGLIRVSDKNVNAKFLYYLLQITAKKHVNAGMGNAKLMSNVMGGIPIPIPPLQVQKEIVRILDKFTQLEAELEARKKQYAYYRDGLFKGSDVVHTSLGEVSEFKYGFTDAARDVGDVKFLRITDIGENGKLVQASNKYIALTTESKKYLLNKNDLLMARTGATYGKTMLFENDEPAVYASFLIRIRLNESKVLPAYYWHFAQSELYWAQANKLVSKAGQPQFNANVLKDIVIPVPNIKEQIRIVKILNKFDAIINDLNSGLPAEINSRRKQYEYYRDKLLSFKEMNNV